MPPIRSVHLALWVTYALVVVMHIGALVAGSEILRWITQLLFAPLLTAALLTAMPRSTRTTTLLLCGVTCAWVGDFLGLALPTPATPAVVLCFIAALLCYTGALFPRWSRTRDPLRIALAIPYGGVVIGLFVACADGAGALLPVVAAYAVALATMAFLSAGSNGLTWSGGTLFLLSSSLLAMDWFLPGASIALSTVLVMTTYAVGHALLIGGMIHAMPQRRWTPCRSGSALVIVEN
ncbi:lysoplasmalogenase family protein [Brachybacterium sp. YJGR34]|uniref:lysoplasmalogenase family protein n=1 Tax=Brachybacterium sp. YJGR34 TaxID=2059911 RepID=UPI000E0C5227|nr:lysoplasmalogenase family protein [Brachybacterium sp. YJGR34]